MPRKSDNCLGDLNSIGSKFVVTATADDSAARGRMDTSKSVALFVVGGSCEIGGGYVVWLGLREGRSLLVGLCWCCMEASSSSVSI
jgi:hypothetical protein